MLHLTCPNCGITADETDLHCDGQAHIARSGIDANDDEFFIVEPNIEEHKVFKLTHFEDAFAKADIVVYLVAHNEFKNLPKDSGKKILDFAGIVK